MGFFYSIIQIAVALLLSLISLTIYRGMPAGWLCDYGEKPGEMHAREHRCEGWRKVLPVMWCGCFFLFRIAGRPEPVDALLAAAVLILLPAALSDCDYMIIPDQSAAAMMILGLIICATRPEASLRWYMAGGALALILMLLSAALALAAARKAGVGFGDVKLATSCGVCIGALYGSDMAVPAVLGFYAFSALFGAGWFAVRLLARRVEYGDFCPMAPWIAASALLWIAAGLGGGV